MSDVGPPPSDGPVAPKPCTDGATKFCSVTLGDYGGVLTCYYGTQTCQNGTWGGCIAGGVTSQASLSLARSFGSLLSLSEAADCVNNPCDPDCQNFDEEPDEPVLPDEKDPIYVWTSGSLAGFPAGLVNKGISEPCGSGYDCQFNHICEQPRTSPACVHSKCAVGVGLDPACDEIPANQEGDILPCVAEICLARPECCSRTYDGNCDHDPCDPGGSLKSNCDNTYVGPICDEIPSCCLASSTVGSGASDPLVAEAEHAVANFANGGDEWDQKNDNQASGNKGMQAVLDDGDRRDTDYIDNSPRLDFPFNFVQAGTWYVWVRGQSVDNQSNSDSVHVGLDLQAQPDAERITGFTQTFSWRRERMNTNGVARIDVPSAGRHTVNVWMREDGFWFDEILLTRNANYVPSGEVEENGMVTGGAWTSECAARYEQLSGRSCSDGSWTRECVDMVKTVCAAECAPQPLASCAHAVCTTGVALDGLCHPCAAMVCAKDPTCCITGWDEACVDRVPELCGSSCPVSMYLDPPERGRCVPRLPGAVDDTCDGVDLSVGIPCDGIIPVCNHGTQTAPKDIHIIHLPANSQQYPLENPEIKDNQAEECWTPSAIAPGHCINVTGCLPDNGNREIMVNPEEDPRFVECTRKDNWSLFSGDDKVACKEPACSESDTEASFKKVHLYVLFDKSGSMGSNNKWTGSVAALKAFFAAKESAGLHVALEFFPLSDRLNAYGDGCGDSSVGECSAVPCSSPMVPGAELTEESAPGDAQEKSLIDALGLVGPGGMTPAHPALDGALSWARAGQADDENALYAVVMVTDGQPTVCNTNTTDIAALALSAYLEAGIRTYTIGMEGADIRALDKIALAGGTSKAFVVRSGDAVEQDLLGALRTISGDMARCQFDITNGGFIDPRDATVIYTPGKNGDPVELPMLGGETECGTGFYYDNPDDPSSAVLCPSTCSMIEADSEARVNIRIGCATPYEETTVTQVYESDCGLNRGTQWGYLSWESDTPRDSKITFFGRSAPTADELEAKEWVELEVVEQSAENEVCPFGGDPDCTAALFPLLGGIAGGARYPVFELQVVLTPTEDLRDGPVLNRWEVSYTCLDNE